MNAIDPLFSYLALMEAKEMSAQEYYEAVWRIIARFADKNDRISDHEADKLEQKIPYFLSSAIELDPKHVGSYIMLGRYCRENFRMQEAISYYSQAISFDPNFSDEHFPMGTAQFFRAEAYLHTCRYDEAEEDLIQAAGMGHEEAKKALAYNFL